MYIPPHFAFDDDEEIQELIRRWPLATVVVHGSDGLAANHIPLIIEQEQTGLILHGHIARANPLSRIDDETPALAVFQGPSAYISPSWYATKQQHEKVVPTLATPQSAAAGASTPSEVVSGCCHMLQT